MDENELNGTEIAAGIGVALVGFGVAGYIAVQGLKSESQETTPKPPQTSLPTTTPKTKSDRTR